MKETILNALNFRYATKIFDKEKQLEEEDLNLILNAGRLAPTAYGLQPIRVIHVKDKDLRERIKNVSFGQNQVTDSSEFFVIARSTNLDDSFVDNYISNIAKTRGVPEEILKDFSDTMKGDILTRSEDKKESWAGRQAYIALGMMLETAALLQIDACPMEGFIPNKVDEILNLNELNLASVGFMAVGYRSEDDQTKDYRKVRVSKSEFLIEK